MGEIFHCPDYLEHHPLFKEYGSSLHELAEKDYPGSGYFRYTRIPTIDLDGYERSLHIMQDCTSDAVVGIADLNGLSLRNKRLLLSEFRMGYRNVDNLDFLNIRRKYTHSCDILRGSDYEIKIDQHFALIFTRTVAPLAKNRINRLTRGSSQKEVANLDVYWPESFCNYINYGKEVPVESTLDTKRIITRWCKNLNLTFEELEEIYNELNTYWWRIRGERLYVDLSYIRQNLKAFISDLCLPPGEDGELWKLVINQIVEILDSEN